MLQYAYTAFVEEYNAMINVRRRNTFQIDSADDLHGRLDKRATDIDLIEILSSDYAVLLTPGILSVPVTLFNCSVGRSDCSRCRTADQKYGCAWCGGARSKCSYRDSCAGEIKQSCPAPVIHLVRLDLGPCLFMVDVSSDSDMDSFLNFSVTVRCRWSPSLDQ